MSEVVGKVTASLTAPVSVDTFGFWMAPGKENEVEVGYVVVAEEDEDQKVYGLVTEMKFFTDVDGAMSDFMSHDFGDPAIVPPTSRQGMFLATAEVIRSNPLRIRPIKQGKVRIASAEEVQEAYGMNEISDPILCGVIPNGKDPKRFAPAFISEKFVLGPEGAHVNIAGASGLATKTSVALFLMRSILSRARKSHRKVAVIALNVKSEDLMFLERNCDNDTVELLKDSITDNKERAIFEKVLQAGVDLKFDRSNLRYFAPGRRFDPKSPNSLRTDGSVQPFYWSLQEFKSKDSPLRLSHLFDPDDLDDKSLGVLAEVENQLDGEWKDEVASFEELIKQIPYKETWKGHHASTVAKVRRLLNTVSSELLRGLLVFDSDEGQDLPLDQIGPNEMWVVDIQALSDKGKRVVFQSIVSRVADRLEREKVARVPGEPFEGLDNVVIFVDELNKFASSEMGKAFGLKQQIIEIAARGRSIGLVLMGAQQFASAVDKEVFGNCSTYFVGRSEFIELEHRAYRWVSRDLQYLVSTLPKGKLLMKHAFFNRPVFIEFPRPLHTWGPEDIRRFEESATAPVATLIEGNGQLAFKRLKHLVGKLGSVNAKELFETTSEIKKAGFGSSTFIDMWRSWQSKGQYKHGDANEKQILERTLAALEKMVANKK